MLITAESKSKIASNNLGLGLSALSVSLAKMACALSYWKHLVLTHSHRLNLKLFLSFETFPPNAVCSWNSAFSKWQLWSFNQFPSFFFLLIYSFVVIRFQSIQSSFPFNLFVFIRKTYSHSYTHSNSRYDDVLVLLDFASWRWEYGI